MKLLINFWKSLTPEKAYARLFKLGKMISETIQSKEEPIREFEEINTLFEKHFITVN